MYLGDATSTLATGAGTAVGGPVGGAIGSVIGSAIGSILGSKPADHSAWAIFDGSGTLKGFGGNKQDSSTTAAAQAIGNAMAARINTAKAQGVTISLPRSEVWVQIGERDPSILRDASGMIAPLAGRGDTQGTMNAALNWIAQYASNPALIAVSGYAAPAVPATAATVPGAVTQPTVASGSVPGLNLTSLLTPQTQTQPIIITQPGTAPVAAAPVSPVLAGANWAIPAALGLLGIFLLSERKR